MTRIERQALQGLIERYQSVQIDDAELVELYALLLEVEPQDEYFDIACELIPELERRLGAEATLRDGDEAWLEATLASKKRIRRARPQWLRWTMGAAASLALGLGLWYTLERDDASDTSWHNGVEMTQAEVDQEVKRALAMINRHTMIANKNVRRGLAPLTRIEKKLQNDKALSRLRELRQTPKTNVETK